jgi:hypothetical protein
LDLCGLSEHEYLALFSLASLLLGPVSSDIPHRTQVMHSTETIDWWALWFNLGQDHQLCALVSLLRHRSAFWDFEVLLGEMVVPSCPSARRYDKLRQYGFAKGK